MTLEHLSIVVVAAELILMVLARLGSERRHWRHGRKGAGALQERDDIRLGPGLVYSVAALALVAGAVLSGVDFDWSIGTLSLLAVMGILVPGYAANSVMLLGTQGHQRPLAGWQEAGAYVLAALGGAAAVPFV
ncbi:hypothetical protein [Streptomyces sp. NPDC048111]|uniref:hypothetical protein n=1 Tax=Streptomyces sp. NPDC048111 TaxID=3365500 RepID=UPI00371A2260